MPIVPFTSILAHAMSHGYAVGYFEAWDLYSMEAALAAAEETRSPCILGFGGAVTEDVWLDHNGIESLSAIAMTLAARSTVPTAVLFNEAKTYEQAVRGLRCGCNAVMVDSSHEPSERHEAVTALLVRTAHAVGAAVESELGSLPNAHDPSFVAHKTDPTDAVRFVAATGIDALAVSIGNVHILEGAEAPIDFDLMARIHEAVSLPLVIHGGTGFPAGAVTEAIRLGAAKFNVGTTLKRHFLNAVSEGYPADADIHALMGGRGEQDVMGRGRDSMKERILELIELYGSAGHAKDL